jgi:hypothetical protein
VHGGEPLPALRFPQEPPRPRVHREFSNPNQRSSQLTDVGFVACFFFFFFFLLFPKEYSRWLLQGPGRLRRVECFTSDKYEPYVVLRKDAVTASHLRRWERHGANRSSGSGSGSGGTASGDDHRNDRGGIAAQDTDNSSSSSSSSGGGSDGAGPYDERFAGYGKNKIELVMRLRARGWRFLVLPRSFAVHVPHPPSAAHATWKGKGSDRKVRAYVCMYVCMRSNVPTLLFTVRLLRRKIH